MCLLLSGCLLSSLFGSGDESSTFLRNVVALTGLQGVSFQETVDTFAVIDFDPNRGTELR